LHGVIAAFLVAAYDPATAQQDPLRTRLAELDQGGTVVIDKAPVMNGHAVAVLYRKRESRPIWTDAGRIRQLQAAIGLAEQHGLTPADYRLEAVAEALALAARGDAAQTERLAELDIALTDSLVRIVDHLRHGKVEPSAVYPDWNFNRRAGEAAELSSLSAAIARGEILAAVEHACPQYPVYKRLLRALAQYRQLMNEGGWPTVDAGPKLQPGAVDPRVVQVGARLKVTGELAPDAPVTDVYDADLVKAVQRFQARHGLAADGEIGPRTLAALNTSAAARVDQIRVNLERARWALHELRETYVVVDIAGYQASYVRDGKVVWQSRVQVGQPLRKTPVLKSKFTDIVLNPNWTVPPTILSKDIIPGARKDPRDFEKRRLRILDSERNEIDPSEVDWSVYSERNFPYVLRQDPGPGNALGRIKFNFPNKHAVYMHDTPKKSWFDRSERAFSSGCIRVDKPMELAELLLADGERWSQDKIKAAIDQGRTRTVVLSKPVPVLILYWTVDVDEQGGILFKRDVYDQDRRVLQELRKPVEFRGNIRTARGALQPEAPQKEATTRESSGA
jgi:murein L,D-transpeptidase YcbB/YkuD